MTPQALRLARELYQFADVAAAYVRAAASGHPAPRGMRRLLWWQAHRLAAALTGDEHPAFDDLPPVPPD